METLHYTIYSSPLGPMPLVVSARGLAYVQLPAPDSPGDVLRLPKKLTGKNVCSVRSDDELRPYLRQLEEYFAGARREFTFALDLRGTDFQQRCWQALRAIPYGATRTYAELAQVVGCPNGFRAVGMANHDNPLAIVVPCHRVIASDGSLGGYGGGLEMKRRLLELEGARITRRTARY